jgi:hypothetical protein
MQRNRRLSRRVCLLRRACGSCGNCERVKAGSDEVACKVNRSKTQCSTDPGQADNCCGPGNSTIIASGDGSQSAPSAELIARGAQACPLNGPTGDGRTRVCLDCVCKCYANKDCLPGEICTESGKCGPDGTPIGRYCTSNLDCIEVVSRLTGRIDVCVHCNTESYTCELNPITIDEEQAATCTPNAAAGGKGFCIPPTKCDPFRCQCVGDEY